MRIAVSVDVPDLGQGLAFWGALGFAEEMRPYPGLVVVAQGTARLLLLERPAGSLPHVGGAPRDYARHWTPVHLDLHVDDPAALRDRALAAGATLEAWHDRPGYPQVAMMADPFGHGFCLIGPRPG
jgi:hypothetical protein